jgi:hypothetical protein
MRRSRFVLVWLILSAIFIFGLTFLVALSATVYRTHWAAFTPPREDEFGPENRAPDFTLQSLDGTSFHLAEAVDRTPVVLEIGSFT